MGKNFAKMFSFYSVDNRKPLKSGDSVGVVYEKKVLRLTSKLLSSKAVFQAARCLR